MNTISSSHTGTLQPTPISGEKPSFKKNEIIYGKIIDITGDRKAIIQIGGFKLNAVLDAAIQESGTYWFQVTRCSQQDSVQLKVLQKADFQAEPSNAPRFLLDILVKAGINRTKRNVNHLHRLLQEQPGISRENLQNALRYLAGQSEKNDEKMMSSISFAINNKLPFTPMILDSLYEVQGKETLYDQFKQLFKMVSPLTEDHSLLSLKEALSSFITQDYSSDKSLGERLSNLQKSLGLKGEITFLQQLAKGNESFGSHEEHLKLLLVSASAGQSDSAVKEKIDQLVLKLNGQALFDANQGLTQHHFMQIPLNYGQFQSDLSIGWTSKKNENGEIDPDYCRVLFYLNMNVLKDTMIDLHIQNRIMSITIYNQFDRYHPLIQKYGETLKETLKKQNYVISSLRLESFHKAEDKHIHFMSQIMNRKYSVMQGVDIKI
jgi:hypothetical protein